MTLGALAAVAAAPSLAGALPSPAWLAVDAPTWIGGVAMFTVGLAAGRGTATAGGESPSGRWSVAALAVLAGVTWPLIAGVLAAGLALLRSAVPATRSEVPEWRPALGAQAALTWGVAVALSTASWSAVRASLDPTVGGAAVALAVAVACAGAGHTTRRALARPQPAPRALWAVASAGLVVLFLLSAGPERSWELLAPKAGSADPRPVLWALLAAVVAPGALAAGWVLGPLRITAGGRASLWAATGLGLLVGIDTGPDLRTRALVLAAVIGLAALWRPTLWGRLRGAGLVAAAVTVVALPLAWPETHLPEGRFAHLQDTHGPDRHARRIAQAEPLAAGWGPGGGVLLVRRADGALLQISEGLPLESTGRFADAASMAGHLARALAPRFDRALVLGDSLGHVTTGLVRDLVERTVVSVPDPEAVRARAEQDPKLSAAFLHPTVSLERGGAERVVRQAEDQDIVVEVARTPWTDGTQGLPGRRQLRARRELLEARQGLYVLVVDVTRLDDQALRGALADVLSVFPETWAFLPPRGADQLLLASWVGDARAHWDQFLAVETIALDQLSAIGLSTALDLADRAAVGPAGLASLAATGRSPRSPWLPGDLHSGPYLGLEMLEPYLEGPAGWLETGPMDSVATVLEGRVETKRTFLRLLGNAVRGDTQGVFTESRALLGTEDGEQTLDPLLAPYLERARELLRGARAAGLGSRKWSEALAELDAARLMNPRSTAVLSLQADTHLALGNLPKAEGLYAIVLELDPGHLSALLGSAQVALVSDDFREAERLLRQASERNVRSWVAHHNLGEFLANAHRYPDAERHLKLSVDLSNGQQAAPFAALSTVYLEQGDVAASLLQANRALTLQDSAEHRYLVARSHYELGNVTIALTHAKRGALRDPSHLGCHFVIGLVQAQRAQHRQCVGSFKRVLELQPGNEPAIQNLRRCRAAAEAAQVGQPD